jgi:Flp pilus assembly pilin Flp
MFTVLVRVCQDDEGHDTVEYVLVLGFVTLAAAAMYYGVGGTVNGLWQVMNGRFTAAGS